MNCKQQIEELKSKIADLEEKLDKKYFEANLIKGVDNSCNTIKNPINQSNSFRISNEYKSNEALIITMIYEFFVENNFIDKTNTDLTKFKKAFNGTAIKDIEPIELTKQTSKVAFFIQKICNISNPELLVFEDIWITSNKIFKPFKNIPFHKNTISTSETLHQEVDIFIEIIKKIKDKKVSCKKNQKISITEKKVWNINDLTTYSGLSKSLIYKLTSTKNIPHYKPNGKQLFFDKIEIEDWLLQNKRSLK